MTLEEYAKEHPAEIQVENAIQKQKINIRTNTIVSHVRKRKSDKQKHKYAVEYRTLIFDEQGNINTGEWRWLGETWAVSENKAVRNVLYQLGVMSYSELDADYGNDSSATIETRARLIV